MGIVVFMGFARGFACCLIVCLLLWALVRCRFLAWVDCDLSLGLWFWYCCGLDLIVIVPLVVDWSVSVVGLSDLGGLVDVVLVGLP